MSKYLGSDNIVKEMSLSLFKQAFVSAYPSVFAQIMTVIIISCCIHACDWSEASHVTSNIYAYYGGKLSTQN